MSDFYTITTDSNGKVGVQSPYLTWFENNLILFFDSRNDIKALLSEAPKYTDKIKINDDKLGQFINELWMLRYSFLIRWFLDITPIKNEDDFKDAFILIDIGTRSVLNKISKNDYKNLLEQGIKEYKLDEISFSGFKNLESYFTNRVAEKIPLIVFDCTGGVLGGERYEAIVTLIEVMIESDKKAAELAKKASLTNSEINRIKKDIKTSSLTKEDYIDAFKEILKTLN